MVDPIPPAKELTNLHCIPSPTSHGTRKDRRCMNRISFSAMEVSVVSEVEISVPVIRIQIRIGVPHKAVGHCHQVVHINVLVIDSPTLISGHITKKV